MHPILAPMIERNAFVGGCDGVSIVKSGEALQEDPEGTMSHSLVLCMGSTVEAIKAYDEAIDPKVKRVAIIYTVQYEKCEVFNVDKALGEKLYAVRFDTPDTRRGSGKRSGTAGQNTERSALTGEGIANRGGTSAMATLASCFRLFRSCAIYAYGYPSVIEHCKKSLLLYSANYDSLI